MYMYKQKKNVSCQNKNNINTNKTYEAIITVTNKTRQYMWLSGRRST